VARSRIVAIAVAAFAAALPAPATALATSVARKPFLLAATAARFAPINTDIVRTGQRIHTALAGAGKKSDAQLARDFGALATATGSLARRVAAFGNLPHELTGLKRGLVGALGLAQRDLVDISKAARRHDVEAARSAEIALLNTHAPRVQRTRTALARRLGTSG
jgi:hypothetical protein